MLAPAAEAVMHPQMGRFLQRDPLGYIDGQNTYQYVRSNPVRYVDFSGRWKWDDGKRNGEARAIMLAEEGDTIDSAARFTSLDPEEPEKWLYELKDSEWVKSNDQIEEGCKYSVPNIVYVSKGDVGSGLLKTKDWFNTLNFYMSWRMNEYIRDMRGRGYKVDYNGQATNDEILAKLGEADIHGWFFAGHGTSGLLQPKDFEDGHILFPAVVRQSLHHKLGFVTLYSCEAGQDRGWLEIVSQYGILRADDVSIHPSVCPWTWVPEVERENE